MITFFAMPKPFKGHIAIIQKNAIRSWTMLRPACEIILFGDEDGTAELAAELGIRHVPEIVRNEYGTPLVSDLFEHAQHLATNDILCYVNADIILLDGFVQAVERVVNSKQRFLMVGQRWNIDLDKPLEFDGDWKEELKDLVSLRGKLFTRDGIDYFVFRRGSFLNIPAFAIGRPIWDNWMIYRAVSSGFCVVDSTRVIMPIHQNHDYSHVPKRTGQAWEGPEAQRNRALGAGCSHTFTLDDATHIMTPNFIRPAIEFRLRRTLGATRFDPFAILNRFSRKLKKKYG